MTWMICGARRHEERAEEGGGAGWRRRPAARGGASRRTAPRARAHLRDDGLNVAVADGRAHGDERGRGRRRHLLARVGHLLAQARDDLGQQAGHRVKVHLGDLGDAVQRRGARLGGGEGGARRGQVGASRARAQPSRH